ncbi:hypothetical protein CDCA_CDCA04G1230 [Cyanidium caldarium]|uniref:Separase n=1 Tax=Cyanidium caldarium TaxID=2771 RepID=A0AAV9ISC5_CYACA|nr:hypothetical protein CDCA_CDCA04G1230 [Cyanidium caldarium]
MSETVAGDGAVSDSPEAHTAASTREPEPSGVRSGSDELRLLEELDALEQLRLSTPPPPPSPFDEEITSKAGGPTGLRPGDCERARRLSSRLVVDSVEGTDDFPPEEAGTTGETAEAAASAAAQRRESSVSLVTARAAHGDGGSASARRREDDKWSGPPTSDSVVREIIGRAPVVAGTTDWSDDFLLEAVPNEDPTAAPASGSTATGSVASGSWARACTPRPRVGTPTPSCVRSGGQRSRCGSGAALAASSGPASAAAPRECSPCLTRSAESRRLGSPAGKHLRERSPESYSTMPLSPRARVLSRTRQLHNHMEPHDPRLRARSLYGSDTGARLVSAEAPSEHAVGRAASVVPRWESSSPTDHRTGDPAGHSARATAATDTSSSSTSGGESDWDADDSAIGEAPSATTGSQVDAFTVPRTLFAQSGGLFSRTEADTIPGFFRMVDRARLSYRGRIIVRYPKPSVLVYSKMPETGKNQFSEKELERWLVQFVACAPNAERDKEEVPDDAVALSEEAGRPLTAARIEATARACTRLYRSAAYPAVLRGILRLLSDPAAIVDLLTAASTGGEPETSRRTFSMLLHLIRLLRRLLRHFPVETALYRRTCEALSALTRQFSSAGCPAFSDALRCELAELLIHYGADAFGMPPPVLERQVLQLLERVLRNRPQWPRSVGGVGHNAAGATTTATTSASECRSLHLYVRALFILFACLNELTPADWQPGRHDALEADAVTAFIEDMLMRRQPPAAETATGATGWLVEHLRTACLPQLPKWCWARSRCSLVLGTWASAHGDFATAESHLFEALYVLSRCDECEAAGSPRTIELSEAALTAYADTLLRNDKYRFAIAALRAAANAYEAREGQPPHLLLQRMREVALSQQDYVRAAQAGFALLSTACHCGRSIEALHLTAQLARIMTDAGWFMRAESLLAAVWHAFDACAAEDGAAAAATTDALEGRSSGGCNGPSRHRRSRSLSHSDPGSSIEQHLFELLMLLAEVHLRTGRLQEALLPLQRLLQVPLLWKEAIVHRKMAEVWLRLGVPDRCLAACAQFMAIAVAAVAGRADDVCRRSVSSASTESWSTSHSARSRLRAPPETAILALLYAGRLPEALQEVDRAIECTSARRLRNLARLAHLRGTVLYEWTRADGQDGVASATERQPWPQRSQLALPRKIRDQLLMDVPPTFSADAADVCRRNGAPPTPTANRRELVLAAQLCYEAAAQLYHIMSDEVYASLSALAAVQVQIEWEFERRWLRGALPEPHAALQRAEQCECLSTASAPPWNALKEGVIDAAYVIAEANLVQPSLDASLSMAELMVLCGDGEAALAFMREAWATLSSLLVDGRHGRFAFEAEASFTLVHELTRLCERLVKLLMCFSREVVNEMLAVLDVYHGLVFLRLQTRERSRRVSEEWAVRTGTADAGREKEDVRGEAPPPPPSRETTRAPLGGGGTRRLLSAALHRRPTTQTQRATPPESNGSHPARVQSATPSESHPASSLPPSKTPSQRSISSQRSRDASATRLVDAAYTRVLRDVLLDTARSETAQLHQLLRGLEWSDADSPQVHATIAGADDARTLAWSMLQRCELQTERYRRGEISASEYSRLNEDALETWLDAMSRQADDAAVEAMEEMPRELLAEVLYVCRVGEVLLMYQPRDGFRQWMHMPRPFSDGAETTELDACSSVVVRGGVDVGEEAAPASDGVLCALRPVRISATGAHKDGQRLGSCREPTAGVPDQASPPSVDAVLAWRHLLAIEPQQWWGCRDEPLHPKPNTQSTATPFPRPSLYTVIGDPTLLMLPWELLLDVPLLRAFTLRDMRSSRQRLQGAVEQIAQVVVFGEETAAAIMPGRSRARETAPATSTTAAASAKSAGRPHLRWIQRWRRAWEATMGSDRRTRVSRSPRPIRAADTTSAPRSRPTGGNTGSKAMAAAAVAPVRIIPVRQFIGAVREPPADTGLFGARAPWPFRASAARAAAVEVRRGNGDWRPPPPSPLAAASNEVIGAAGVRRDARNGLRELDTVNALCIFPYADLLEPCKTVSRLRALCRNAVVAFVADAQAGAFHDALTVAFRQTLQPARHATVQMLLTALARECLQRRLQVVFFHHLSVE